VRTRAPAAFGDPAAAAPGVLIVVLVVVRVVTVGVAVCAEPLPSCALFLTASIPRVDLTAAEESRGELDDGPEFGVPPQPLQLITGGSALCTAAPPPE
jgi:hypothetical protein